MSSSELSVGLLPHRHFGFGPLIDEMTTTRATVIARKAKNINDSVVKEFLGASFRIISAPNRTTAKNNSTVNQPCHVTGVQP